jgi:hypothetical protein
MGMHVDHGSLLSLSSNGLIAKVAVCATLFASYRAIYCNRHSETSAFPQPRPSANRAGQAARRRGDREQEVVLLIQTPCAGKRSNARRFRDKSQTVLPRKLKSAVMLFDRMSITRATENINI